MDKTPQLVSGTDVFGPDSRFYYSIRTRIDPAEYPQVHDFYEIILVTGGELGVLAAGARFALRPGGLLLLRPGDAHTKLEQGPCTHIDLAFPAGTARELVRDLYQGDGPLRALAALPELREVVREWNEYLLADFDDAERAQLMAMMERVAGRAQAYIQREVGWDA